MPAKNPRLTITLQPSLAAQLRRLSELTGNSQSALISELLDGSAPIFDKMISVLSAADEVKQSFKGSMVADLARAQETVERQLGLSLEAMDVATKPLLDEAERVKRRSRRAVLARDARGAGEGVATPLSNRGVRSTTKQAKTRGKNHGPI
jgi:hypothetical protein